MRSLSPLELNHLPDSAFIFPEEKEYPIPDRAHAYDALRQANLDSPERADKVREEVLKRFNIGRSGARVTPPGYEPQRKN